MKSIDLNCDMGESFGAWKMGNDAGIMPSISSVSIACGFHAGDPSTIAATVRLAASHGVAIGAHPSFPDLEGFGRREMSMSPSEIYHHVSYQVAAVKGICEMNGEALHHVKPHGALYNQAAGDARIAAAISKAVRDISGELVLYGLSGSHLISQAESLGLRTASEVFADRTYTDDGRLTPRTEKDALIEESGTAVGQVLKMIETGSVTSVSGAEVPIKAETVCIHGDGPHAVEFAKEVRANLDRRGITVRTVT